MAKKLEAAFWRAKTRSADANRRHYLKRTGRDVPNTQKGIANWWKKNPPKTKG